VWLLAIHMHRIPDQGRLGPGISHGVSRWLKEGITAIKDNYRRPEYAEAVDAFRRRAEAGNTDFRPYIGPVDGLRHPGPSTTILGGQIVYQTS
jgi:hypothetical protein